MFLKTIRKREKSQRVRNVYKLQKLKEAKRNQRSKLASSEEEAAERGGHGRTMNETK